MNERTEALAKQAAEYAIEFAVKDQELYIPRLMEKFAELIVQECIDIAKPTGHHEVWAQSYSGGVDGLDLLYSKIKDIKRHFGVEE